MKLDILDLGLCSYDIALQKQYEILEKVQQGTKNDTLILVEHPPVITMGRNANEASVLFSKEYLSKQGVELHYIERGGDATYHGPGQLVGYPIFNLKKNHGGSIRSFVDNLEEVFIQMLKTEYQLSVGRNECNAGVWLSNEKILAIGLAVKKGVTMHGFAFNVNTILEHFALIVPCGLTDKTVTSLEKILGHKLDMGQIKNQVIKYFSDVYGYEMGER